MYIKIASEAGTINLTKPLPKRPILLSSIENMKLFHLLQLNSRIYFIYTIKYKYCIFCILNSAMRVN